MNYSTPPKGSLEDLFRHHLLESEAAAVPPRPQVWEQIDNTLLIAENEKYRRRLVAYRWAMAASLLLASLAGGGWWRSQQGTAPAATLAQASPTPAERPGLATVRHAGLGAAAPAAGPGRPAGLANASSAPSFSSTSAPAAIDPTSTSFATTTFSRPAGLAARGSLARLGGGRPVSASHYALAASAGPAAVAVAGGLATTGLGAGAVAGQEHQESQERQPLGLAGLAGGTATTLAFTQAAPAAPTSTPATASAEAGARAAADYTDAQQSLAASTDASARVAAGYADAQSPAGRPAAEGPLAGRPASPVLAMAALPGSLAPVDVPRRPLELARRWQYGATYAASTFDPNIDFTQAAPVAVASASNTAFAMTNAVFSNSAAAEYRRNLRAGLGQRLSLWATRRLGNGRWGLRTGLEMAQHTATSATSVASTGEPTADFSSLAAYVQPRQLQRTDYRYRSVSVPVELQYANPLKTGFSLYGRVGALVTALLSARSEVEGNPGAARTYSPLASDTPYRRLAGSVRGGGGLQYRPAGHQWALSLGPVAELGILSLNANPSRDFWGQSRPYSFGLEAGMELGRGFRIQ